MPKALHFLAFCTHDSVFVRGKERIAGIDGLIGITTAEASAAELCWKSHGGHKGAGAFQEVVLNGQTFTSRYEPWSDRSWRPKRQLLHFEAKMTLLQNLACVVASTSWGVRPPDPAVSFTSQSESRF